MIREKELMELSYPDAPKISGPIPGPKGKAIWDESARYETPTRVGGSYFQVVWQEALGATVKDADGNVFIDMTGGLGASNVGHTHPKVVETIRQQSQKLMHTLDMVNPQRVELAKKLSEIMPKGLRGNCFTAYETSGSGAIETALKFAKMITGKKEMIAFQGGFHGVYGHCLALTVSPHYRIGFEPFVPGGHHLPYGYCYRCFAGLTYPQCGIACGKSVDYHINTPYTGLLGAACVILEPIQGEGGYVDPPKEFVQHVAAAAKKAGAVLIFDEIQSGFGRSGKMWAVEHYDVEPDILVWAKGVAGDTPLSGVTVKEEFRSKLEVGSVPATFPGNALSCAVAMTNIEIMTDPKAELIKRAEVVGEGIKNIFRNAMENSPLIGEVRGKGFMLAVELVKNKKTKEPIDPEKAFDLMMALKDKGVLNFICGRYGNTFRFLPPLVTPKAYFEKAAYSFLDLLKEKEKDLLM